MCSELDAHVGELLIKNPVEHVRAQSDLYKCQKQRLAHQSHASKARHTTLSQVEPLTASDPRRRIRRLCTSAEQLLCWQVRIDAQIRRFASKNHAKVVINRLRMRRSNAQHRRASWSARLNLQISINQRRTRSLRQNRTQVRKTQLLHMLQ